MRVAWSANVELEFSGEFDSENEAPSSIAQRIQETIGGQLGRTGVLGQITRLDYIKR